MYAAERQQAIARLVVERRRVAVTDLASEYRVTTETVRRDLTALERMGLVRRVHGGVVPADSLTPIETALSERDLTNTDAKDRIARAAVAHLPNLGGTVLVDAGSTTARLAAHLGPDHAFTAWTHAVPVAARLATLPRVDLHLLPGRVRPTTGAAVGPDTVAAIARLRVDVAFLGTNALDEEHGLATPDPDEAAAKRALVAAARRVVVLCDSAKIGRDATVGFAEIGEVDVLVTDDGLAPADRGWVEAAGVEVVIA